MRIRTMKRVLFAIIGIATLAFVGCDDDYTPSTSLNQAFQDRYPNATHVEWERERGHRVAEFYINGQECEAWYTASGKWVMTLFDIKYSDLPAAVKRAFETEFGVEAPIDDVERLERNTGEIIYIIDTEQVVNGFLTDIYLDYAEDGTLLRNEVEREWGEHIYYYL